MIYPEQDAAERLARSLAVTSDDDYLTVTKSAGVARITAPDHAVGMAIGELERRCGPTVQVVGLVRADVLTTLPDDGTVVERGDALIVIGDDALLERFAQITTA